MYFFRKLSQTKVSQRKKSKACCHCWAYFIKQIVILNIVFEFVVLNSIWEHGLNIFFDIVSNIFKRCPRSVNSFRTEHLGDIFGIFGPRTSLKHPSEGLPWNMVRQEGGKINTAGDVYPGRSSGVQF